VSGAAVLVQRRLALPAVGFWDCLEALAAKFAAGHDTVEANLDRYVRQLEELPADRQKFRRHDIDVIVTALTRLSVRLS
jgi:hypothetical protein